MSRTHIPAELRRSVRLRAGDCCEYCLIPESMTLATHEIDHVIAEKHGGPTEAGNLALACALCNGFKGSDLASIDAQSGAIVPLFNPRRDRWPDYFRLEGGRIEPLTASGRATVRLLQLNDPHRIEERLLLVAAGIVLAPAATADHS
ncbi:MAG TPA: HNH endonuclease [Gemmataceae bacterium]|nr:HNH endonuclease [Gemmataceae bacterium]